MATLGGPDCPVCATEIPPSTTFCPRCGYPVSLHEEAVRGLSKSDGGADGASSEGWPAPSASVVASRPAEPVSKTQNLVLEIEKATEAYRRLGGRELDESEALTEAVLLELDGRSQRAAERLEAALAKVDPLLEHEVTRGLRDVEALRGSIRSSGVSPDYESELAAVQDLAARHRWQEAATLLLETWGELKGLREGAEALVRLLARAEEMLAWGRAGGVDLAEAKSRHAEIAERLAKETLTTAGVAAFVREANELSNWLNDALPERFQQELELHAGLLSRYPAEHRPAQTARAHHAAATAKLDARQLAEASQELEKLIRSLPALGEPWKAAPVRKVSKADAKPAPPRDVKSLVERARALAVRVRTLPAGTALTREATARIREATGLLKVRRLKEAEDVLDRLLVTLDMGPATKPK